MKPILSSCLIAVLLTLPAHAQNSASLRDALTMHASFDTDLNADFSRGDKTCYVKQGKDIVPAAPNEEVKVTEGGGRFGNGLHFTKKGAFRPQFKGADVLNYNDKNWSTSVSIWLRLDPDKDLEPGYCDPVQIVGDDSKKGFIFLEWSKDETPRFFRYAIRPLHNIWNPNDLKWDEIPADKRPMVQLSNAPFSRDKWTHVVFSLENANARSSGAKPIGKLHLNGELKGTIENWDLTLGWDPGQVWLVLGASYVGHMDDLAVFNRALTDAEVKQIFELQNGVSSLRP